MRAVDDGADRGDQFVQIVGRNIGRHADRDAGRAVHQQPWQRGGQDSWFGGFLVVIGGEINGVLVEVAEQFLSRLGEAALGVAVGGGRVAIDRAEIALGIDQRVAEDPGLGEAHQCIVDGSIAMRVVVPQHLADDLGALVVGPVVQQTDAQHRIKNAPLDRLETVPRIGQGARNNHRHRVIDVGRLHDVGDIRRREFFVRGVHCGRVAGSEQRVVRRED